MYSNVLEAARLSGRNPIFIYASTNKAYGGPEKMMSVWAKFGPKLEKLIGASIEITWGLAPG